MFNNPVLGKEMQDKYNVLYYACLLLNNNTENELTLKIPPEIEQTVQEMVSNIRDKERFYGYKKAGT